MKKCNVCSKEILSGSIICGGCDVVAVVRCIDCKYSSLNCYRDKSIYCACHTSNNFTNGYCNFGEKRSDAE